MFLNQDDIENILYLIPDPFGILDFLAPLEIERLSDVLYCAFLESLNGMGTSEGNIVNYEPWKSLAKEKIKKEINESMDYFGIKNLSEKIAIDDLLKIFYEYEFGEDNTNTSSGFNSNKN